MRTRLTASVLGLAMIAGCSSAGYKAAEKTNNSLSDVKSELVMDKAALRTAVDDLNDLIYKPQSDLRPQYEKFAAAVTVASKSSEASRKSARGMVANREAYLAKWRADTSAIPDTDLRMRAMDRINETQKSFAVLGDRLLEADNARYPLVNELKAMRDYLGNDLTANNIKLISDRATSIKNRSITANEKIDAAIVELDKVSDQMAPMPSTQPTAEPAT